MILRPATPKEREKLFKWLTQSNLSGEMFGPPKFPETPTPTRRQFDDDYHDYYFDGSQPTMGRCFVIIHEDEEIGQINYNEIDANEKSVEIDIWLADKKFTGRGLGTEAIQLLCFTLRRTYACRKIFLAPSRRNTHAIKSYIKAGFTETDERPANFTPDYDDAVVMVRKMDG